MNDQVFMQGTHQNFERYLELIALATFSSVLKCLNKLLACRKVCVDSSLPRLSIHPGREGQEE